MGGNGPGRISGPKAPPAEVIIFDEEEATLKPPSQKYDFPAQQITGRVKRDKLAAVIKAPKGKVTLGIPVREVRGEVTLANGKRAPATVAVAANMKEAAHLKANGYVQIDGKGVDGNMRKLIPKGGSLFIHRSELARLGIKL
ncbi:MAG: hypothetical protein HY696_13170 [Deltaproteobacteria bacterium]|nr:hypothetical protein [Deltaproteobacteria bacterium]